MIKAKFIVISGESLINKFIKAVDAFDGGKIVAQISEIYISYKEEEKVSFERLEKLIPVIKEQLESKEVVALIHLHSIIYENNKTLFNNEVEPYINKSVREISDGKNHVMFYKILQKLSIEFQLTETCYIA